MKSIGLVHNMFLFVLVGSFFLLSGCTTISKQEMNYMGNDEKDNKNVVGTVEHIDFFGIGYDGDTYAEEYEDALKDAYKEAPPGTNGLKNIKVFRENDFKLQILGLATTILGASLTAYSQTPNPPNDIMAAVGGVLSIGGVGISGIREYDYYIIAEPME